MVVPVLVVVLVTVPVIVSVIFWKVFVWVEEQSSIESRPPQ